jgi:hypothetical protein
VFVAGDEKTAEVPEPDKDQPIPGSVPPRAVFSDDFDDPLNQSEDELPEDEPLTPEIVEEEAIRGDFMLRWATVFLALLMAFGQLNDTRPLVLVKSGDLMRANGFLPPRTDSFALTTEGKPITNVSWLFDHLVSLSWAVAGVKGLTLLKVAVAGVSAWLLVSISIPGISTWWSSICAIFAVVACSSDFLPLPELITIPGMVLTMRFLAQHRLGQAHGLIWKLPLLIAIWCNLDSRAWVGVGVIAAYALGSSLVGRSSRQQTAVGTATQTPIIAPALLCVAALLVNPFHLSSLLSPLTTYSIEYPALQSQRRLDAQAAAVSFDGRVDAYSIANPSAVVLFDHSQIAGLAVLLMAFAVLVVTRSRRDLGFLFALMFVSGLILLAAHELPAAAIVACVVAGIGAQDWYRRTFSMKYTTETSELVFSRGGRAVTVLALAGVGFCVVAARLPGAMPLGFGFDRETQITIDTLSSQLKSLPEDARILHTRIEQGDVLIWNNRKSFVDSRILPFGRPGAVDSVFGRHANVLSTLLQPPPQPAKAPDDPQEKDKLERDKQNALTAARATLTDFQISHIMTRLAPPGRPDYTSMFNIARTGEWVPVSIGASAAIVEKIPATATEELVMSKLPPFKKMAFQSTDIIPAGLRQFAGPRSFYEKYVYRTRPFTDSDKRLASHYLFMASTQPQSMEQVLNNIAALTLAVRHMNTSLAERSDNAESFEMLGRCYARLGGLEQVISGGGTLGKLTQVRYLQSVVAFRQALTVDPEYLAAWDGLFGAHVQMNRLDLALECLDQWTSLAETNPPASGDEWEEYLTQRFVQKRELEEQIEESDKQLEEVVKQQVDQIRKMAEAGKAAAKEAGAEANEMDDQALLEASETLATAALINASGRPKRALALLRENAAAIRANPLGTVMLGQLQLECGEAEDAHRNLALLGAEASKQPQAMGNADWQLPTAISQLAIADYTSAADTWGQQLALANKQLQSQPLYTSVLFTLPMVADANMLVNDSLPLWPFRNTSAIADATRTANEFRAEISLLIALTRIEEGLLKDARTALMRILADYGDTSARPLATLYFSMLDDNAEDFLQKNSVNLWEDFEYPGEVIPAAPEQTPGSSVMPQGSLPPGAALGTPPVNSAPVQ